LSSIKIASSRFRCVVSSYVDVVDIVEERFELVSTLTSDDVQHEVDGEIAQWYCEEVQDEMETEKSNDGMDITIVCLVPRGIRIRS
jgi:hypothetical protein